MAELNYKRILVVYDQVLMAANLARFINSWDSGYEASYAETAEQTLSIFEQSQPGIVLLDLNLKATASDAFGRYRVGIELLQELRRRSPQVRVVMMSFEKTPYAVWDSMERNGAAAFVSADDTLQAIMTALTAVAERGSYRTAEDNRWLELMRSLQVTPVREETLRLLASGLRARQIADSRGVEVTTVIHALGQLRSRFDVTGEVALVMKARELGFFPNRY